MQGIVMSLNQNSPIIIYLILFIYYIIGFIYFPHVLTPHSGRQVRESGA